MRRGCSDALRSTLPDTPCSIGGKVRRGNPHWACSCSLFGGTGDLTRKGEGSDHLIGVVHLWRSYASTAGSGSS